MKTAYDGAAYSKVLSNKNIEYTKRTGATPVLFFLDCKLQINKTENLNMEKQQLQINFNSYDSIHELDDDDAWLLQEARSVTAQAYAPYSKFKVAAVIRLSNGEIIAGTNQENASYPVGICAERVALSTASSLYPEIPIETIAVSYHNLNGDSSIPISPCGICRQTLAEYEKRQGAPIRLIMGGLQGKVFILDKSSDLLPLGFSADNLSR